MQRNTITANSGCTMILACVGIFMLGAGDAKHIGGKQHPPELGKINWLRGFEQAKSASEKRGKPMMVLFQEVPGCGTCVTYGNKVLSHPLIVEAAETLFTPVVIYNNIKGDDEKTLKSFNEPAWNNPVIRMLSVSGESIAPRLADDYSVSGVVSRMVAALKATNRDVPQYLEILNEEESSRRMGVERATFSMHCFWEGEVALGALPGVVGTSPGFIGKTEVVDIDYNPKEISFTLLLQQAIKRNSASGVFARSDEQAKFAKQILSEQVVRSDETSKPDKQPKYHLFNSPFRYVPMTELQAIRINEAVSQKQSREAKRYLSPRQQELLLTIEQHPKANWTGVVGSNDLAKAWQVAMNVVDTLAD